MNPASIPCSLFYNIWLIVFFIVFNFFPHLLSAEKYLYLRRSEQNDKHLVVVYNGHFNCYYNMVLLPRGRLAW